MHAKLNRPLRSAGALWRSRKEVARDILEGWGFLFHAAMGGLCVGLCAGLGRRPITKGNAMKAEPVKVQGLPGEGDLYLTQEKVVSGVLQLLQNDRLDDAVAVWERCEPRPSEALRWATRTDVDLYAKVANLFFRVRDFGLAARCCEDLGQVEKAELLRNKLSSVSKAPSESVSDANVYMLEVERSHG